MKQKNPTLNVKIKKSKGELIGAFALGVLSGTAGMVAYQKIQEKRNKKILENQVESDINDTINTWNEEDDENLSETDQPDQSKEDEENNNEVEGEIYNDDFDNNQYYDNSQLQKNFESIYENTLKEEEFIKEQAEEILEDAVTKEPESPESPELDEINETYPEEITTEIIEENIPEEMTSDERNELEKNVSQFIIKKIRNMSDTLNEIEKLLSNNNVKKAKRIYRESLLPIINNNFIREHRPEIVPIIEKIGEEINNSIFSSKYTKKGDDNKSKNTDKKEAI